jgi:hypothetical protein
MKYLKRFNENISIYNPDWEKLLPETFVVLKGQEHGIDKCIFKKSNVMLNADMIQISYSNDEWMIPDTFEIDIYFVKDDTYSKRDDSTTIVKSGVLDYSKNTGKVIPNLRLTVDITFGDDMASEFTIDRVSGDKLLQDTTYGSKFDPTNTLFALDDDSLKKFVEFLNRFNHGVELTLDDFKFLQQNKN